jgi:hypothetical protein
MNARIEGRYSQFQTLTSRGFGSRFPWVTKSAQSGGRSDNLRRVYQKGGNLTLKTRKGYKRNTRVNFCKIDGGVAHR